MFGQNPKRKPELNNGRVMYVQEVFSTIQGEGPFVGQGAVFVRLNGCNLACDFCDTEFEDFNEIEVSQLIGQVKKLAKNDHDKRVRNLVVVTGGEPLRQNLKIFCETLLSEGFKVQIETNGTIFQDLPEQVSVVCSPKNSGENYGKIRPDLLSRISAVKFIISASNPDYNFIPKLWQEEKEIPVYIQPMDEYDEAKNKDNIELVKKLVLEEGYFLSLQTHKILGID